MSSAWEPRPTPELFVELQKLAHDPPGRSRSARAWPLISLAHGNGDAYYVLDFALEHGLIDSCAEACKPTAPRGQAARHFVWTNPVDGSEMVWIPEGSFFVGPREKKQKYQSQGFSLARHPITNGQFAHFLEESGYTPPPEHPNPDLFLSHWDGGKVPTLERHPVVWVSYLDALAYCDWAGMTLPTEWLWEKAARGPDGPPFPWGDQQPRRWRWTKEPELANLHSSGILPVGSFPQTRSAYGCEDMVGNVSEWCQMTEGDDYGQFPKGRPRAQIPEADGPVYAAVRGACFLRSGRDNAQAWHRRRLAVIRRNRWVGFRPACFLPFYPT